MDMLNFLDMLAIRAQMLIPMTSDKTTSGGNVQQVNIGSLLNNFIGRAKNYGGGIIIALGIIMIVVAGFKIGKGLMTQGKPNAQPINWFLCGGLLLVGCMFAFGGFNSLSNLSKSVGTSVDDLTGGGHTFGGGKSDIKDGDKGSGSEEFY